jgi:two-component system osmolarity sensor histidine kinase EnvZ
MRIRSGFSYLKKYLPRSLFGRSLLILIIPIVLIQTITAIVFLDRHWSHITSRLSYAVAGEISTLADIAEADPHNPQIQLMSHYLGFTTRFEQKTTLQKRPKLVTRTGYSWESMVSSSLIRELNAISVRPFSIDLNLRQKRVRVSVYLNNGILHVQFPGRRLFSSSTYIFLFWMLGTSVFLLIVAILFMRGQVRPIRRLAVAANKLGKGQNIPRFKPSGAREVRQAAQAFIDMQHRIKRQLEQRTLMLAGISHDLRTPLTRLKLNMAMLPDGEDKAAMEGDIADMEQMIGAYLDFVQSNTGEDVKHVECKTFIDNIVQDVQRQGIKGFEAQYDSLSGYIQIREHALRRCVMNIIENAARYGAGKIYLSAAQDDHYVSITVEDNGKGLHEDEFDAVMRPFYRVDESRNFKIGGTGLGLSIAQDIAHAHGGQIILGKSTHGGLSVCIRLPL